MMDLERQLLLEQEEMVGQGATRMRAAVEKARENANESRTLYAKRLMAGDGKEPGMIEKFSKGVEKYLIKMAHVRGRKPLVVSVLKSVANTDVVAFIAIQVILDAITKSKNLTNTAVMLGQGLEDELRFTRFEQENPAFWQTLLKDLTKREPDLKRRRYILIHEMEKGAKKQRALKWKAWTKEDKAIIGLQIIDLMQTYCKGLVKVYRVRERKRMVTKIAATPKTLQWIEAYMEGAGFMLPAYLPTIIPPRKWKKPTEGGYYLKGMRPLKLVKVHNERGNNYLTELGAMPRQLRQVYASLNAVQSTPWKINKAVLATMMQAKQSGMEIGKAPRCVSKQVKEGLEIYYPIPPKPVDVATNEEARTKWKRSAATMYRQRVRMMSKSIQHVQLLTIANRFKDEAAIYFPMQLDFRGRMYAVPSNLNPQGNDPAKGLLTFARGKKIGVSGLRWLLIHAANMWGEDKISLDDREQWALDHLDQMNAAANDPLVYSKWWTEADKPWQFLATCMEIEHAYRMDEPTEYVCSIPITVDGTCNGLQHFSAMLLDQAGAESVNLAPSAVPQDIYQVVADRVKERFEKLVQTGGEGAETAAAWLKWGFDRKATKRAVMIVPYSGTEYAAKDYTIDYIKDRKDCPFTDNLPAYFFARHVWAAIAETIVSARQVMNWLRKIGRAVSRKGAPIIWTTPAGFPVKQDYRSTIETQIRTQIGRGIEFRPVLRTPVNTLDHRAMEQGISPNFIHSYDAACLMLTVCRLVDEGIFNFAMVHDSYGTLAADMDQLGKGLRQAFVDIYQNDVMGDFFKSATSVLSEKELGTIPERPPKGTFVLETVKDSYYFFA